MQQVLKVIILATLLGMSTQLFAGSLSHCPDLSQGPRALGQWKVITGELNGKHHFNQALVSKNAILGTRTVTCKYNDNLNLYQMGSVQIATPSNWQAINLAGVYYWQCLMNESLCDFYLA